MSLRSGCDSPSPSKNTICQTKYDNAVLESIQTQGRSDGSALGLIIPFLVTQTSINEGEAGLLSIPGVQ